MSFMLDLYAGDRIYKVIWEALFLIFFIWSWKHLYTGWKELFDDKALVTKHTPYSPIFEQ